MNNIAAPYMYQLPLDATLLPFPLLSFFLLFHSLSFLFLFLFTSLYGRRPWRLGPSSFLCIWKGAGIRLTIFMCSTDV